MLKQLGGAFDQCPEDMGKSLSTAARDLLARVREGIDPTRLRDYHVHILGVGAGNTGATVNPRMNSWRHPRHRFKSRIYMSAAGVDDFAKADSQYIDRLLRLVRHGPGGSYAILALDHNYHDNGRINAADTEFYVPNDYVLRLAGQYPEWFVPVISVHPCRDDALDELARCAASGARYVKWLPNAQNIDPAAACCDPFYEQMAKLHMTLLTHTGKEMAVQAQAAQEWGNPLRLRRPLEHGVKVIMAHAGSLGASVDLDCPTRSADNFELVLRLLEDPNYNDLLFAEISATTQINRLARPLLTLLARTDLHTRLVNGSDYPLPAVNCLIWTRALQHYRLIDSKDRRLLNEIYRYNPLVFDFAIKRVIRHPDSRTGFPATVFHANPALP